MTLHKEGYKLIAGFFLLFSALGALVWFLIPDFQIIRVAFAALMFVLWMLIVQFFRIPKRNWLIDSSGIVCPADGKVVVIEEVAENRYLNSKCIQVSIFMSPLNVHVNRYPISGVVEKSVYQPGKFLVAWHPKSSEENEMHTIVMRHDNNSRILLKQIAGAVARRIVNYSTEGQKAEQCAELGFIKFGSRVDVLLPLSARVQVKIGDVVKGGTTLLASF
jgi:phosphatidylserine decarboxylase